MGKAGKLLKGCLIAVGWFLLSSLLLVGLYIAWGMYANSRAEKAATALCAGTHVGERIETVRARAAAGEPKARLATGNGEYHFIYQGAMFSARDCQVSTVQGVVTATRTISDDDRVPMP